MTFRYVRATAVLALLSLTIAVAACTSAATAPSGITPNAALIPVTVQLSSLPSVQHFGVTYATREGLYEAEGLDVTFAEAANAVDPMQMVDAGQVQIGIAGAERLIIAAGNGIETVVFAAQYQKSPQALTCREDAGVRKITDLSATKVGLKTSSTPGFAALMAANGIDERALTITPIGDNDVSSIIAGVIGCQYGSFAINEPVTMKLHDVGATVFLNADNGLPAQGNAYFTSPEYYERHRDDVVVPFLRATIKAWEIFLEDPAAAAEYVVKNRLLEGARLDHQSIMGELQAPLMRDGRSANSRLLALDPAVWEATAEAVFTAGTTNRLIDVKEMLVLDAYEKAQ